jgi:hypothetical protein
MTPAAMIDPIQHKQLFLDDSAIAQMSGVTRQLHQPFEQQAVIHPDRSKDQVAVQSRSAPQWNSEKGLWEWWYWSYYRVAPHGPYQSTEARGDSYATSTDGVHWEKPALGLFEWQGSRQNNIAHDPQGRMLYHIVRDEAESDPQRRYKALFDYHNRYLGVSPDGFTWTMLDVPPIPSQDESHFLYDAGSGQYLAYVKQPTEWGRSVWLATSRDFEHFSEPQLVFHSDATDQANRKARIQRVVADPAYKAPPLVDETNFIAEVYQMAVMPYEGLYVGFPVLFNPAGAIPPPHRNYTALNQVELTVSPDRVNWARVADRALFLEVDPADASTYGWAQKLLCGTPHVHAGREIWIYYNSLRFRGPEYLYDDIPADLLDDASALVLAKVRLDGFVSLDAGEAGMMTTKPFLPRGGQLLVNIDAAKGTVSAEVLDAETQQPLTGFGRADAIALQGDHLRGPLRWQGQSTLAADRAVQVRFHLQGAKLYSFWMEPS